MKAEPNQPQNGTTWARRLRMYSFVAGVLLCPLAAPALGFRIPNQDAEATAKGNAFIATADNPSAIYYNPAGITQIKGTEAQMGFHVISINSHFDGENGSSASTKWEIQAASQFYAVYTPSNRPFSFGLGMYAPYGLGLQWPAAGPFRDQAIEGRLIYASLTPIIAWQVLPSLSIAAGPTFNYSQLMLLRGIGIVPNDEFHFRGEGWAYGAKAGIRWQPLEKWVFGLSYCSPTKINYEGSSSIKPLAPGDAAASAEAKFPQFVMGGVSFRPNDDWNIELGVDWTDWGTVNTVQFKGAHGGPFPLNWESSYFAHFGAQRRLGPNYWVAGGYFFSQNSTTEKDFTPLVPDTDLHVFSLGFGRKGEHWSWAVSGQIIAGPHRTINNGSTADGSFQFFNQAINLSLAYHF